MRKDFTISEKHQSIVDEISKQHYGGHFTIFGFTSCFSFSFGTINSREEIYELGQFETLEDAVIDGIQKHFVQEKFKRIYNESFVDLSNIKQENERK